MVHDATHAIKTIDAELKRRRAKTWYEEDDVSPDELLDLRLTQMREREIEALEKAFAAPSAPQIH